MAQATNAVKKAKPRALTPRQFAMQVMLRVLENGPATIREIEEAAGLTYCGSDGFASLASVLEHQGKITRVKHKWERGNKRRSVLWALVEKST